MSTVRSRAPFEPSRADLAKLFDKIPPHAIESEAALIGAMILDSRVIGDVIEIIKSPDDFYQEKHGLIFSALVHLYDHHEKLDIVQIKQRLEDQGHLDNCGGVPYLIELGQSVPDPTNAPYYARIVRDKSVLRQLIDATGRILYDAYTSREPVQNLLDGAEKEIFKIAESPGGADMATLEQLVHETYQKLEAQEGRHITGLASGFFDLDELTAGLQPGELIILAARPSMGKTAFALNVAEHVGVSDKQSVAVFSLEMSRQQLAQRLLCSRSGVDAQRVRRNMLRADDWPRLHQAMGELSDAPFFIDDTPGLTLLQLRAKARRMAARYDIKLIIIDYLQLMSAPGSESRQQEVSELSRGIKAMARDLSVPVVCLSQLNRASEGREGHRPRMSDLRESGSIEQDADVVLMLHREEYYHVNDPDWANENPAKQGLAEIIIAKQRNGPTGVVELRFDGATTRFQNLAHSGGGGPDFGM
ncbi:MAG: replicative DNA helicase [Phycisphaeraceae bacterium]